MRHHRGGYRGRRQGSVAQGAAGGAAGRHQCRVGAQDPRGVGAAHRLRHRLGRCGAKDRERGAEMRRAFVLLACAVASAPLLTQARAEGWLDSLNRHLTPQGAGFVNREVELLIAGEVPLEMLESDVKAACPHPHSCLDEPKMDNQEIKLAICALAAEHAERELTRRPIDLVAVKGKERAVAVYELLGELGSDTA